jgi:hypothetical protein
VPFNPKARTDYTDQRAVWLIEPGVGAVFKEVIFKLGFEVCVRSQQAEVGESQSQRKK